MIDIESAHEHHLSDIAIRKLVAAVPSDAQVDDFGWMAPPLERQRVAFHV
jgi:hypothetical protein